MCTFGVGLLVGAGIYYCCYGLGEAPGSRALAISQEVYEYIYILISVVLVFGVYALFICCLFVCFFVVVVFCFFLGGCFVYFYVCGVCVWFLFCLFNSWNIIGVRPCLYADVSCFTSTTILVSGARVLTLPDCTVCQDMYAGALREFKVQLLASIYYSRHPCMPLNTRTYFTFVRSDIKTNANPKREEYIDFAICACTNVFQCNLNSSVSDISIQRYITWLKCYYLICVSQKSTLLSTVW